MGSIPGSGRSPGGGNGNPLQYTCPENSINRRAWQATVHGIAKTRLDTTECFNNNDIISPLLLQKCNTSMTLLMGTRLYFLQAVRIFVMTQGPSLYSLVYYFIIISGYGMLK